jgi:hypothetical protein
MFTYGSLLIVLAIVAISVRNQLHASRQLLPTASASAAGVALPAIGVNDPRQAVSQYQRELDKAMKAGAQHTADQSASAADEAGR